MRVIKMLWAGLQWKPALQTRALSFGQRITFMGDPNCIAIATIDGDVVCYDVKTTVWERIYSTNDPRQLASTVHSIQAQPITGHNLGLSTNLGPVILRYARSLNRETDLEVIRYGEESGHSEMDCIDFHPSGTRFATAGPNSAGFFVWDYILQSRRQITTGINRITALSYSPCGNYIAAGRRLP